MVLTVYSIRHYMIKYIDIIIINYDYRIYGFDIGKMVVYREHNLYVLPKVRYDITTDCSDYLYVCLKWGHFEHIWAIQMSDIYSDLSDI